MKKVITYLLSAFIFVLIIFAIIKVIYHINEKKEPAGNSAAPQTYSKKHNAAKVSWKKNQLIIPYEFWQASPEETELINYTKYNLIESLGAKEKCALGEFAFESKSRNFLVFENSNLTINPITNSKLEEYAKLKKDKITLSALSKKTILNLRQHTTLEPCTTWIKFEKNMDPPAIGQGDDKAKEIETRELKIHVKSKKCFSQKKILVVYLTNSKNILVQNDQETKKLCITGLHVGKAELHFQLTNKIVALKIDVNAKKGRHSEQKLQKKELQQPSFDEELGIPYKVPGWRN